MIPWRGGHALSSAVVEVFNGLRGEAREKAIATGNYDALVNQKPEREPGQDDEPLDDPFARAMGEEVSL
jgi:hypothetical protein